MRPSCTSSTVRAPSRAPSPPPSRSGCVTSAASTTTRPHAAARRRRPPRLTCTCTCACACACDLAHIRRAAARVREPASCVLYVPPYAYQLQACRTHTAYRQVHRLRHTVGAPPTAHGRCTAYGTR
eukprot:scaffold56129_cov69-Phaeocystis_antarctica.AAC.6